MTPTGTTPPMTARAPAWEPSVAATRTIVGALATVALLVRLTYVNRVVGLDEAGFLTIARQWHGDGRSLYTDLWVDRPPVLLWMFQLGDLMGGLTGLRVLGAIIAATIVVGTAVTAHLLAGRRAAIVAAVAITAWSVSPAFGSLAINGEFVAAPFVVWSMAASLAALRSPSDRRAHIVGLLAGASATTAVFVKQNHADGLVFGLVACLLAGRMFGTPTTRAIRVFVSAAIGCVVALGVITLGCLSRGTSPGGVVGAMYASRSAASSLQKQAGLPPLLERSAEFRHVWIVSGLLLVMLVAAVVAALHRRLRPALVVLAATLTFSMVAVYLGNQFFAHYMVQLLVPTALLAGLAASRSRLLVPGAVALTVASAVLVTPGAMFAGGGSTLSSRIGGAMHDVGEPGDSIVVLYGRPGIVLDSGMRPAYENLFRLTTKIRDPQLTELNRVLRGDDPPTWIVLGSPLNQVSLPSGELNRSLDARYERVGTVCKRPILLLESEQRDVPEDVCHDWP